MSKLSLSNSQRLFGIITLSTFVALVLVRLLTSELYFLSSLGSVLWACQFLGLGVGCLNALLRKFNMGETRWFWTFTALVILLTGLHFTGVRDLSALQDGAIVDYCPEYLPDNLHHELVVTCGILVVFYLVSECFISLGMLAGKLVAFTRFFNGLKIYFLASAVGWLIYGLTLAISSGPVILVGLVGAGFLLISGLKLRNMAVVGMAICCALLLDSVVEPKAYIQGTQPQKVNFKNFWAPEFHVMTHPFVDDNELYGLAVTANHKPFQLIMDLGADASTIANLRGKYVGLTDYSSEFFSLPFRVVKEPKSVLILGAGAGNEVAEALKSGAAKIDAVDAHAWLFQLGEQHPQRPFSSDKVRRIVMDPRTFLKSTQEKYDLIVFGSMDVPSFYSPLSLLRPNSYAYTVESFADARAHLNTDGFLTLTIKPLVGWYVQRMVSDLGLVFGSAPAVIKLPSRLYIIASCASNQSLAEILKGSIPSEFIGMPAELMLQPKGGLTSLDDWPFDLVLFRGLARQFLLALVLFMAIAWFQIGRLVRISSVLPEEDNLIEGRPIVISRHSMYILFVASAFMLCSAKMAMTLAFNFGATWQSAIGSGLAVSIAGLAACLWSFLKVRSPGWILWPFVLIGLGVDYFFNYAAIDLVSNLQTKIMLAGLLPLVVPFVVGIAIIRGGEKFDDSRVPIGMFWFGLTLGAVFLYSCFFLGIAGLNIVALVFCLAAMALGITKVTKGPLDDLS